MSRGSQHASREHKRSIDILSGHDRRTHHQLLALPNLPSEWQQVYVERSRMKCVQARKPLDVKPKLRLSHGLADLQNKVRSER